MILMDLARFEVLAVAYEKSSQQVKSGGDSSGADRGSIGVVGVPVGPGEEDVEEHVRDLLQLVRINSFPGSTESAEWPAKFKSRYGIADGVAFDRDCITFIF